MTATLFKPINYRDPNIAKSMPILAAV